MTSGSGATFTETVGQTVKNEGFTCKCELKQHTGPVHVVKYSPDGCLLASGVFVYAPCTVLRRAFIVSFLV